MTKLKPSTVSKIAIATVATSLLSGATFHVGTESTTPHSSFQKIPASVNTLYTKWLQKYGILSQTPSEHLFRQNNFLKIKN